MKNRWLLNLALLILISGLVLLVVYEPGKQPPTVKPITPLAIADINRISIKHDDADINFKKQATHWLITSPIKAVASQVRINGLMGMLGAHSFASFEVTPEDLTKYGIGKGQITFNDTSIIFGDTEDVNKRRYVYVNNRLHLIVDSYYHQLITDSTSFVSTGLLPPGSKITSLDLKPLKQPHLILQRTADDGWLVLPDSVQASADQFNALIHNWQTGKGLYVSKTSEVPSTIKETSKGIVDISLASGATLAFEIINSEEDGFILRRPDINVDYHMLPNTDKQLLQLPVPQDSNTATTRDAATPATP